MNAADRVYAFAILIAAAVYLFWFGFQAWRKNRLIEDMPVSQNRGAQYVLALTILEDDRLRRQRGADSAR